MRRKGKKSHTPKGPMDMANHLAYYDSTTNLPNRTLFEQSLAEKLYNNEDVLFSVLFLDIDRFKYLNETFDHKTGDELLKEISKRLGKKFPKQLIARVGGDEFALLFQHNQLKEIDLCITKVQQCFQENFKILEYELHITTSIGISTFPQDGRHANEILRNAHNALYRAKEKGKGSVQYYSPQIDIETNKVFFLEHELYKAFEEKQFFLTYQPRINVKTGKIAGAEALIRWRNKEGELINPIEFIPLAEEIGLIIPISEWALREVCMQNKRWQDKGYFHIPISVNLSTQHFLEKNVVQTIKRILEDTGLEAKYLEIEVTENILIQNTEVMLSVLKELRELGVQIALDDFGTGYCSLSYLKNISMDIVKIDRTFISNIPGDTIDTAIVNSVIHLAKLLQKKVVAEGVETAEQMRFLFEKNCDEVQGYLFSKPLTVPQFEKIIEKEYHHFVYMEEFEKNRRQYLRIDLNESQDATISISEFFGREKHLEDVQVRIADFSTGGLRFSTQVKLNVNPEILYRIQTTYERETVELFGQIVWGQEKETDLYEYGLSLYLSEEQRNWLQKIIYKIKGT